jgi:hypothetical protein
VFPMCLFNTPITLLFCRSLSAFLFFSVFVIFCYPPCYLDVFLLLTTNTVALAKFVACCQYQRTICPSWFAFHLMNSLVPNECKIVNTIQIKLRSFLNQKITLSWILTKNVQIWKCSLSWHLVLGPFKNLA